MGYHVRVDFCKLLILAILFSSSLSIPSYAQDSAAQIIQDLDRRYYYPQRLGLASLSAAIEWEQLDSVTQSGRYLRNPDVNFHWDSARGRAGANFQIIDKSFEISETRKAELMSILENYEEVVIPQTLAERVSRYQGEVKISRGHKKLIQFVHPNPDNNGIQKYEFYVDLDQGLIPRLRFHQNRSPYEVRSDIRYTQKDGKWLVAESRSRFQMGGVDYTETLEYTYRQTKGFWLIGKMTQTVETGDRIVQSFIFRFKDYQIN